HKPQQYEPGNPSTVLEHLLPLLRERKTGRMKNHTFGTTTAVVSLLATSVAATDVTRRSPPPAFAFSNPPPASLPTAPPRFDRAGGNHHRTGARPRSRPSAWAGGCRRADGFVEGLAFSGPAAGAAGWGSVSEEASAVTDGASRLRRRRRRRQERQPQGPGR
ncbi:unnamed protein product, partial [Scytosiphon promiscuus]